MREATIDQPLHELGGVREASIDQPLLELGGVREATIDQPLLELGGVRGATIDQPLLELGGVRGATIDQPLLELGGVREATIDQPLLELGGVREASIDQPLLELGGVREATIDQPLPELGGRTYVPLPELCGIGQVSKRAGVLLPHVPAGEPTAVSVEATSRQQMPRESEASPSSPSPKSDTTSGWQVRTGEVVLWNAASTTTDWHLPAIRSPHSAGGPGQRQRGSFTHRNAKFSRGTQNSWGM